MKRLLVMISISLTTTSAHAFNPNIYAFWTGQEEKIVAPQGWSIMECHYAYRDADTNPPHKGDIILHPVGGPCETIAWIPPDWREKHEETVKIYSLRWNEQAGGWR